MNALGVQALPSALDEAERLARARDVPFHKIAIHWFPDGEMRVTVGKASPTTIIYAALNQPNDKLLAIFFAAEALRRDGATRLLLVAPYLCYVRQDAAFQCGEAISQRVVGKLLATVDRVVTGDAHLHRTPKIRDIFPGIEADNLSAVPAIADALRAATFDSKTLKALNYGDFPLRPIEINKVLLTHAHIDHSGLIPKLFGKGSRRIMATRGTMDLCSYLLPGSGSIQESEVAALNRRNAARRRAEVQPIYTQADAVESLQSFRPVEYESWFDVIPGVRAINNQTFVSAMRRKRFASRSRFTLWRNADCQMSPCRLKRRNIVRNV
jgi:hypothetical protein